MKCSETKYYKENLPKLMEKLKRHREKVDYSKFFEEKVIPFVRQRDGGKCVKCGSDKNLVVHHNHYNLEKLTADDLITLCKKCHKARHKTVKKEARDG